MFSGELPFHEIPRDYSVILAVMQGKRPRRPLHDMCQTRGLTDDLWNLIEQCWTDRPSDRPTASHIMEFLHALPDGVVDQRPLDEFDISFSSRILDSEPKHLFFDFAAPMGETDSIQRWKLTALHSVMAGARGDHFNDHMP